MSQFAAWVEASSMADLPAACCSTAGGVAKALGWTEFVDVSSMKPDSGIETAQPLRLSCKGQGNEGATLCSCRGVRRKALYVVHVGHRRELETR